jgi:hypothetical protein
MELSSEISELQKEIDVAIEESLAKKHRFYKKQMTPSTESTCDGNSFS